LGMAIYKEIKIFNNTEDEKEIISLILEKLPLSSKTKFFIKNQDSVFAINLNSKKIYSFEDMDDTHISITPKEDRRGWVAPIRVQYDRFDLLYGLTTNSK